MTAVSEPSTLTGEESSNRRAGGGPDVLGLAIAWSPGEPGRAGEVCIVPPTRGVAFVLGRGAPTSEDHHPRLDFGRQRAESFEPRPPLGSRKISRLQLRVRAQGTQCLTVDNVGRCVLRHNGARVDSTSVVPGDTLQLGHELLLLCVRRPAWVRSPPAAPPEMPFGGSDPHGIVGEAPSIWALRRQIAFAAERDAHVLVVGESGTGKELVARALHALSPRSRLPFVARNAATFPESLVDAELFGHVRNYPNAGMPDRPGIVGQAAGGTLFLDELAELPATLQARLLRVLDSGEYHRLGESVGRVSDFRLLAATNRPDALRTDLAARLKLRLRVPGLDERREDIPLLATHILRAIAAKHEDIGGRLFPGGNLREEPRITLELADALVRRPYRAHVRELEAVLWESLAESAEPPIGVPRRAIVAPEPAAGRAAPQPSTRREISAQDIETALADNGGSVERTWRALGLASRHVLARLMAKQGVRRKGQV